MCNDKIMFEQMRRPKLNSTVSVGTSNQVEVEVMEIMKATSRCNVANSNAPLTDVLCVQLLMCSLFLVSRIRKEWLQVLFGEDKQGRVFCEIPEKHPNRAAIAKAQELTEGLYELRIICNVQEWNTSLLTIREKQIL